MDKELRDFDIFTIYIRTTYIYFIRIHNDRVRY